MKKWGKILLGLFLAGLLLLIGADLGVRWVTGSQWFRNWVTEKAQTATGRSVRIEKLGAHLRGIKVEGLVLAEEGGFENGEFLALENLSLRFDLSHLIHGHIKLHALTVDGLTVRVKRLADGTLSTDSFTAKPTTDEEPAEQKTLSAPNITLTELTLKDVELYFKDEQGLQEISLQKVKLDLEDFGFDHEFALRLSTQISYTKNEQTLSAPLQAEAQINLAELNLAKATAELKKLSASLQDASVRVSAKVKNFQEPDGKISVVLKNLSSALVQGFVSEVPEFEISEVQFSAKGKAYPAQNRAEISALSLELPGVEADGSATVSYGEQFAYQAKGEVEVSLKKAAAMLPSYQKEYKPTGTVRLKATANNENLSAEVISEKVGVFLPRAGELSSVEGKFTADTQNNFKTGELAADLTGKMNGEKFEIHAKATQTAELLDLVLHMFAKRVALPPLEEAKAQEPSPEFVEQVELKNREGKDWPFPAANIKAEVRIDSLDAPYLYGTDIVFLADLSGIKPDLKTAQGDLSLRMGNGKITDLYRLTNSSPITKVLFLSLNIVGKVFNSLNVFAVLGGIGNGVVDAVDGHQDTLDDTEMIVQTVVGENGEPVNIKVPRSQQKMNGHMVYDKFDTVVEFKDGVANVKEGQFVSDMMSFNLSGTTNFKTEEVDMTVHAAPGKHEADGMMPLTLKIGGTVSEPKGSMSLVGSVSSLITQSVTNNFASRSVKKGISGFFGLFKREDSAEETLPVAGNSVSAETESAPLSENESSAPPTNN
ncbi:MAG: AsmA family protein [Elusimicrobium sp.]|uniref:AsmA family protein n=1 Tax=Candidatus Avelusimicrobium gallicola TaxID=2562704 RepID=A0A928HEJ5_9BACT|nr:AsmA family protein [Elusimicrobium sp.]